MWKSGHAIEPDHVQLAIETLDGFSQTLTWHNLTLFQWSDVSKLQNNNEKGSAKIHTTNEAMQSDVVVNLK